MTPFELGRLLYEARLKTAWNFGNGAAERRLAAHPYPRHVADQDLITAESDLAIAQAQAVLSKYVLLPLTPDLPSA